ncbi:MAG: low molecular weight protein-tyrosine-phosphatase [Myxococcota bacterium]
MVRVMFFCLGNICRSPLAHGLFVREVERRGWEHTIRVDSSGTSAYHVGELPDPGSRAVAKRVGGIDISDQRAQQLTAEHLRDFDYLVAMSHSNIANARHLKGAEDVDFLLLRDFEPQARHHGKDVPDPWGKGPGAFDEVYQIVERSVGNLLDYIAAERGL